MLQNNNDVNGYRIKVDRKQSRTYETPRRNHPTRSANYSHSTFPRRRQAHVMQPISPLHTMFDPPANYRQPVAYYEHSHAPAVAVAVAPADHGSSGSSSASSADPDQTPKAAAVEDVSPIVIARSDSYVATPTPKKSHDSGHGAYAYGHHMETPIPMHHQQNAAMPMGWFPPFPSYPYGPPMSPYGPMTPHATPGMMYPGYSPNPYFSGMYPEMYSMASPPHMMPPPPQMAAPPFFRPEAAPAQAAPVQVAPVQAAPVQAAPARVVSAQGSPTRAEKNQSPAEPTKEEK